MLITRGQAPKSLYIKSEKSPSVNHQAKEKERKTGNSKTTTRYKKRSMEKECKKKNLATLEYTKYPYINRIKDKNSSKKQKFKTNTCRDQVSDRNYYQGVSYPAADQTAGKKRDFKSPNESLHSRVK